MLRFLLNKIKNKLWMNICLLLGIVFFIGMLVLNPVYQEAALQKMMLTDFEQQLTESGVYPAVGTVDVSYSQKEGFSNDEFASLEVINQKMSQSLGIAAKESVVLRMSEFLFASTEAARENDESKKKLKICSMTSLENHAKILAGEMFTGERLSDGTFPCMVSMQTLSKKKMILGDVLSFKDITDPEGKPLRLKVTGVFGTETGDTYFMNLPSTYEEEIFLMEPVYQSIFQKFTVKDMQVSARNLLFLDYQSMDHKQADSYIKTMQHYEDTYRDRTVCRAEFNCLNVLQEYQKGEGKVRMIIWILQIPVLVLLLVFLYTVSKQILELEESEISMLKSRGVRRYQLVLMYFEQSAMLSGVGILLGVPFAVFLCKVVGASNSFMEFVGRRNLSIRLTPEVFVYALAASLTASAFMTLPVIRYSRTGIVEQKRKSSKKQMKVGSELLAGVAILGFALYEWNNFRNQQSIVSEKVADGAGVDPILFFSSSLFILGGAVLVTVLIHFLVQLIFHLFQSRMSPAFFASYLQMIKSGGKQFMISIFLVITIAMGIYNSNMARTINENEEEGIHYVAGTDIILMETWKNNRAAVIFNPDTQLKYTEPDYGKYKELIAQSESVARVIRDDHVDLILNKKNAAADVTMLAINTKEFGNTAWMRPTLMKAHWFEYLNLISQNPEAVLITKAMSEEFDLQVGDELIYSRTNIMKQSMGSTRSVVYGVVDYFPGYEPELHPYMIIANYSNVTTKFDMSPYEIWIRTDGRNDAVYQFLGEQKMSLEKYVDESKNVIEVKNDPIFQATNGLLTISFIMILVLCIVGFLIYWILTIHSRELVYGIFRAMGVSMREIVTMLVNEQVYCSCVSLAAGTFLGIAASRLYIPLVEISYSSFAHTLPIHVVNKVSDIVQVGVITGGMVMAGILILGWILKKLNITQALKLGED